MLGWVGIWHEALANDSLGPRSRVAMLCCQEHVREACGAESCQFSPKSKQQWGPPDNKMPKSQELRTLIKPLKNAAKPQL